MCLQKKLGDLRGFNLPLLDTPKSSLPLFVAFYPQHKIPDFYAKRNTHMWSQNPKTNYVAYKKIVA